MTLQSHGDRLPNELLTINEVADRLKVTHRTVRNWIDSGALATVRIGSKLIRIRTSDLEDFISAGEESA